MPFRQAALNGKHALRNMKFLALATEDGRQHAFFWFFMASTSARNQNSGESSTTLVCPASRCPLPTWDRTFSSAEALLEHARQTRTQHPLCTTCLRVFKDTAALDQVRDFVIHEPRLNHYTIVTSRGEACRRMSALQSKIQVAIRP